MIQLFLNDSAIPEELANWEEIEIKADFVSSDNKNIFPSPSVSVPTLEFVGQLALDINADIAENGVMKGRPFRIEGCDLVLSNGYLEYSAAESEFTCDLVKAKYTELFKGDFINDKAGEFRFEFLFELADGTPGKIYASDFQKISYCINKKVDPAAVMILGLSLFAVLKELYEAGYILPGLIETTASSIISAAVALVDILNAVAQTIYLFLYLAYLLLILAALVILIIKLFEMFWQPVKHKLGMFVRTLFERFSEYYGLTFSSTIFEVGSPYRNLVIIPRKNQLVMSEPNILTQNITVLSELDSQDHAYGYFDGTPADLIMAMNDYFNAKIKIESGVFTFERRDFWYTPSSVTIPDIRESNGDPHGTNASELTANYFLTYLTVQTDSNTVDEYEGTCVSTHTAPANPTPEIIQMFGLKGSTDVRLIFAQARRKESVTNFETVMDALWSEFTKMYNVIAGLLSQAANDTNAIMSDIETIGVPWPGIPTLPFLEEVDKDERLGSMMLSEDTFAVPKILVVEPNSGGWGVSPRSEQLCSTGTLMNNRYGLLNGTAWERGFHSIELPSDGLGGHNQYLTYKGKEFVLCCEDFVEILNRNIITTFDGNSAEVLSLHWTPPSLAPKSQLAIADYRVKKEYETDLEVTVIYDGKNA